MTKARMTRRTTVCIYSWHPLVLSEFRRLLPRHLFRVRGRRLEADVISDPRRLAVSRTCVHVLEAHADPTTTEALVVRILSRWVSTRLIVAAERFDETTTFSLLRVGAKGLVTFADASKHLPRAIREVAQGGVWVPRSLLSRFIDVNSRVFHRQRIISGSTPLSRREREVRELLLRNFSNKEIATSLNLSERTAKFHVSNLLAKCGVKRRADLVVMTYAQLGRSDPLRESPAS